MPRLNGSEGIFVSSSSSSSSSSSFFFLFFFFFFFFFFCGGCGGLTGIMFMVGFCPVRFLHKHTCWCYIGSSLIPTLSFYLRFNLTLLTSHE